MSEQEVQIEGVDSNPNDIGIKVQIPMEEMRKRKLFLAVPMYGGMCAGLFVKSVLDLAVTCAKHGIVLSFYFLFNESLITRARNYCCDEFLRSECTHLLFIDSDIGFSAQDVLVMMALMSDDSPYDVMAAPYPKKCISWEKIKMAVDKGMADEDPNKLENYVGDYVFNPKPTSQRIPIGAPVEVLEAGTGFMMVKRSTFVKFKDAYPQYTMRPDHVRTTHFDGSREIHQYFQAEIDRTDFESMYRKALLDCLNKTPDEATKIIKEALNYKENHSIRYLSEDYWFSQKVQNIGLKTWFCPWMRTQHVGSYVFGGSLADLALLGAHATADPGQMAEIKSRQQKDKKVA